jgi:hypothetical protein
MDTDNIYIGKRVYFNCLAGNSNGQPNSLYKMPGIIILLNSEYFCVLWTSPICTFPQAYNIDNYGGNGIVQALMEEQDSNQMPKHRYQRIASE